MAVLLTLTRALRAKSGLICAWTMAAVTALQPGLAADPGSAAPESDPLEVKITGYGLLGNRELKRMLKTMSADGQFPRSPGRYFIEDAAFLLLSRVRQDGYLRPDIDLVVWPETGAPFRLAATNLIEDPLPLDLRVRRAEFLIERGVRFYLRSVEFPNLEGMPEKQARSFFIPADALLRLPGQRVYTTNRLSRSLSNLADSLARRGYADASATVETIRMDENTGAVDVRVRVRTGPKYIVKSVQETVMIENSGPEATRTLELARPYSQFWLQDYRVSLQTNLYGRGYPDARAELRISNREERGDEIHLDLEAVTSSGPRVWIGQVEINGARRTSRELVSRRVRVERGELLDRLKVERGRGRLARLGVFRSVDVSYEPVSDHTRKVVYDLDEAKALNLSLLFGWGSYEMLRGGILAEAVNLWGLAHQARLRLIQSLKSSRGDFNYTVPDLFGRDVELFLHGSGLRREEIDFTRVEYGGGVGARKFFREAATDLSVRYNYGILSALDTVPAIESEGLVRPAVGSFLTDVRLDLRDNPLYPRSGFKVFANMETAAEWLGGEAGYQRLDVSPAWHLRLGGGRYLSLGLAHGVAIAFGEPADTLPFNRRFFPGGDHSIRGYQEGEASPRNEDGDFVGAETYLLGNVEIEQALTPQWSLVFFLDALGAARRLENYPADEWLFSVGGGIRWRTVIGPIRLEYGHNLNPRSGDPRGTLHFAIGYPL